MRFMLVLLFVSTLGASAPDCSQETSINLGKKYVAWKIRVDTEIPINFSRERLLNSCSPSIEHDLPNDGAVMVLVNRDSRLSKPAKILTSILPWVERGFVIAGYTTGSHTYGYTGTAVGLALDAWDTATADAVQYAKYAGFLCPAKIKLDAGDGFTCYVVAFK